MIYNIVMAGILSQIPYGAIGFTRGFVPYMAGKEIHKDNSTSFIIKSKPEICVPVSIIMSGYFSLGYFVLGKVITIGVRDVYHSRIKGVTIIVGICKILTDDIMYKIDDDKGNLKAVKSREL